MGEDYLVEDGAEKRLGTGRWSNINSIAWLADGSALMLVDNFR
jgi:hypothetical protein